ncbi:Uncharacterized protein APZ42_031241 [Daphnia magna]|uniref:Uncharacterized protein n=1 Tax=Daphnia magna TaxID=35525 RepID=A0A164N105_9CRUS|nr:Uncharacterized protein APZ42_031241 [Daphnia magna]
MNRGGFSKWEDLKKNNCRAILQPSRKLWQRPYADWPSFLIIFGPATDDPAKLFKKMSPQDFFLSSPFFF